MDVVVMEMTHMSTCGPSPGQNRLTKKVPLNPLDVSAKLERFMHLLTSQAVYLFSCFFTLKEFRGLFFVGY